MLAEQSIASPQHCPLNKKLGLREGNIEVRVRVEDKKQVLPVLDTLILI